MRSERGDGEAAGIIFLLVIGMGLWWLFGDVGERDGVAKYSDCREVVTLPPDSNQHYYKTFTCTVQRTKSGLVMAGECVHIDYDSGLFSNGRGCKTAYVYVKTPELRCLDPKYPVLHYDGVCYSD
jgi:hypothetical protein